MEPGDLLFFDLETTGLSSRAGTLAFLAAFGRLVETPAEGGTCPEGEAEQAYGAVKARSGTEGAENLKLKVTQYLLLDYPGENDFLEAVLAELYRKEEDLPPLTVTYNGKSFDAQIIKVRCLMNGMAPPGFRHADLLHPARRLWKKILPSCSQGEIEMAVLSLARTGDTPGAMAPDIWFNFLKTGKTAALEGICDHNLKDIFGLVRLFQALVHIAEDPLGTYAVYRCDLENLALYWQKMCRTNRRNGRYTVLGEETQKTGRILLTEAAARGYPRAAFVLARDLLRRREFEAGRMYLKKTARGDLSPETDNYTRAAAYRALAIDAEHRLGNWALALAYSDAALSLDVPASCKGPGLPPKLREELVRRRDRLRKKAIK
jgi:uncharacterized protein YprB with RNaseH-like and TPR domain